MILRLLMVAFLYATLNEGYAKLVSIASIATGITKIHNYYRNLEFAADMKPMVWDWRLARKAAVWSENCYWGHQMKGLGENLAYQWSTEPLKKTDVIITAIKNWYNEKHIWKWSQHCGAACHYTQMVWARTTRIGCAYSICPNLLTSGTPIRNAHYFVCFYSPAGNYIGQYPYQYGDKCSQCGKSEACRQGMCCNKYDKMQSRYLPFA